MWTFPPSRILVPVDFSEGSGRAVGVAADLAGRVGATLHLLHAEVLEVPAYFTREQMQALERERAIARARADEFLSDFARAHGASTFTADIVEGFPTPVIVDAAGKADLVVMGTHGRRGPAHWWLGSVAERVVHESASPVLVVRAGGGMAPAEVFRHPMLLSGSPDERLMDIASQLARAVGGEALAKTAACAADLAAERQASLIVLSSAGRHGTVLSHPAEQWIRSCTLPMLFVPPAAAV
jgi:nucleotide-binding universal stress UspA family protein